MMKRLLFAAALLSLAACEDMYDQPRFETYEKTTFFEDGLSSRPVIPGTVARGHLKSDELFETGKVGGKDAEVFPQPVTAAILERGRNRYDIFCAPCHDRAGYGHGMVVQRGFRPPPSFHQERLRNAAAGHYFDVITNGFGAMYNYASRISPKDRWAIVAYIRALQLSQSTPLADLSDNEQNQLKEQR